MNKGFIVRIFKLSENESKSIEESENLRKKMMLYLLMVLGIVFLLAMGILLFIEKIYFFSGLNFTVMLLILGLVFLVRSGTGLLLCSILSILLMQIFFMFLFLSGVSNHMTFVWYYLFPLIALFLLGTKLGSFFSILMILLTLLLNSLSGYFKFIDPFYTGGMIRVLISYMGVFLFAYAFERTRLSTQKKLEQAVREVNELAIRDSLTGLYNRRYMDEIIGHVVNQCSRSGTKVGFIMADLDYFKKFNDTYGHQAGDHLLNIFSTSVASLLRRQTDYVFRYGGEEFAFLLPSTNRDTTEELALSINKAVRELNIPHAESPFGFVSVSIGAVSLDAGLNKTINEIVGLADKALYEAKNSGRNRVVTKTFPNEE